MTDPERRAAFDRVALPHLDRVHATALYLTKDADRAQDLTQETFLRAYRFFHQFEIGTNCVAWLHTILHNTLRNRYRSEKRERGNVDIAEPMAEGAASLREGPPDTESVVMDALLDGDVVRALEGLPDEFREVVVLVDLQDLTYEEAAEALDRPIGTVRSRLSRARRALRGSLATLARERGLVR